MLVQLIIITSIVTITITTIIIFKIKNDLFSNTIIEIDLWHRKWISNRTKNLKKTEEDDFNLINKN